MSVGPAPRRVGLPAGVTARGQLQRSYPPERSAALPTPYTAANVPPGDVGVDPAARKFIVLGDHGGVKAPGPQLAVAAAMRQAVAADPTIAFVLSLGDVVYFNGDPSEYMPQFWEPYAHLPVPFIAIPGNHDGDGTDGVPGSGISSFMANWCTATPQPPAGDPHLEFGRHTQTQPSHDWAVELDAVTIIGLWSNVPSGGHLEPVQQQFLVEQLKAAPVDRPLLVCVHHPPFSIDAHHGGCQHMSDLIDGAVASAGSRWPTMVLAGHVHDCQRFTRTVAGGVEVTYLVSGNGGYHNLHAIAGDYRPGMGVAAGVVVDYADASAYGFWMFDVSGGTVSGSYTQVRPGVMPDGSDATVTPDAYKFSRATG